MAKLQVVIDVFRAFTTACHVLERRPSAYLMVSTSDVAMNLRRDHPRSLMIGKPEIGADCAYDLPNSPTIAQTADIRGRVVIHRTSAGATGLLAATSNGPALAACFANLNATARVIRGSRKGFSLVPMGHEALVPSLEDDLCAEAIRCNLKGRYFDLQSHRGVLREGPGRYFFGEDQAQYPLADFELCLSTDSFDFPIWARRCGHHVVLSTS